MCNKCSNKKITVVDDDPDILQAIQLLLEGAGYQVTTSNTGDQLLHEEIKEIPDLILLDILLSGIDGREIAYTIKHNQRTQHIPIIMVSAHPNAKKSALQYGADYFLPKPFSIDVLLHTVHRFISHST